MKLFTNQLVCAKHSCHYKLATQYFKDFRSLLTLCRLVPLPGGGEVGAALAADEGGRHGRGHRVQVQDPVDAFL